MTTTQDPGAVAATSTPPVPVSRGRRVARALRLGYGWVVVAAGALFLAFTVTRRAATGRWHWSILLDSAPPVLLVLTPLLLAAAAAAACGRRRHWAVALAVAGLLPGVDQLGVYPAALLRDTRPVPAGAVHLFTWNTNYWGMSNKDPEAQFAFLRRQNADVYLLQEHVVWVPGSAEAGYFPVGDDDKLRAEFPGYHIARRSELVTISRFPIVAQPLFGPAARQPAGTPFAEVFARDKVLRTDLRIGERTISVYNVHVTVPTAIDLDFLHPQVDLDEYYRRKFTWRQEEVAAVTEDVRRNPYPSIVSGDFNATSAMGTLDGLRAVTRDASDEGTQVLPLSWRFDAPMNFSWDSPLAGLPLPFWRIDWTFVRGAVDVHRYRLVSAERLSDHRPQDLWFSVR
ncbi:endonuclease/exonuclease/phosphatase family protein [Micromonospora sp. DT178]|uniref:endonuclease/exonuclease/phosphatase family protein n=1 Tax=Micromonospora sp. DT178 TaxID=3393436 RepID=UPI003CEC907B